MATIGMDRLTLNDLRKRSDGNGKLDEIMEVLAASNPILEHMTWVEGNLTTGNRTTLRNSIPRPSIRYINRGIAPTKSDTKQITDTSVILEARSEVDVEWLALASDKEMARRNEDMAHIEGFGQTLAEMVIYGNTELDPDTFNGLDIRHRKLSVTDPTKPGYTTVDAGGTGNALTSAFFVDWGPRSITGIYPKGATAGLDHRDLGEQTVEDRDGKKFQAMVSLFNWKCGLTVRDYRAVGAIRNIDSGVFKTGTAAQKLAALSSFLTVKNRVRRPDKGIWYVSNELYTAMELFLMDKNNSYVTRDTIEGGIPVIRFAGNRVVKLDAISDAESQIV